jgi:hypothetical protein
VLRDFQKCILLMLALQVLARPRDHHELSQFPNFLRIPPRGEAGIGIGAEEPIEISLTSTEAMGFRKCFHGIAWALPREFKIPSLEGSILRGEF